jgi:hypothetical protein
MISTRFRHAGEVFLDVCHEDLNWTELLGKNSKLTVLPVLVAPITCISFAIRGERKSFSVPLPTRIAPLA